jgi:hypothetical protein
MASSSAVHTIAPNTDKWAREGGQGGLNPYFCGKWYKV